MTEKIKEIIRSVMLDDSIEILPESSMSADLGISSFDLFQIVYAIETEFSISISPDSVRQVITVGDLIKCISESLERNE